MQSDVRLLSEEDLALVHALQLQPRASWSVLGRALDVDPVTVARRWSRAETSDLTSAARLLDRW